MNHVAVAQCSEQRPASDYAQNQTLYFCYAKPAGGGARTALARARLVDEGAPRLGEVKVIFRQEGPLLY